MSFDSRINKLLRRYIQDENSVNIVATKIKLELRKSRKDYILAGFGLGIAIVLLLTLWVS